MEVHNADLSSLRIKRNESESYSGGRRNKKNYWLIIIGVLILAAAIWAVKRMSQKEIPVSLATVSLTSMAQSNAILNGTGYVVAQRKAAVASKGTGRLIFLGVVEGDKVRKDEVIARLDDADIKAQLEQARANLKFVQADMKDAENTYARQKALFERRAGTQAELDFAESRYQRVLASIDVAKAQLVSAEVALENMLIRAPFNGTVLTKNADVGEIVAPFGASVSAKAAVVTLADMTSLEVEADVSESNIERIRQNQECEITLDAYPEKRYPGFVSKIVPTADRSKATVMVKIGFREYDSRVLPEMSAKVLFLGEKTTPSENESGSLLTIPSTAIFERDGSKYVYKVINDMLREVRITTGRTAGAFTEVTSGLALGEKIVQGVTPELKDGLKVKVE